MLSVRRLRSYALLLALALAFPGPLAAAVTGTVTTPAGLPIEGARVEVVGGEGAGAPAAAAATRTGRGGEFAFPGLEPPVLLLVTHPRFQEGSLEVAEGETGPVVVVLRPRQEVFEEIVVSATRDAAGVFQPVSVAATAISPGEKPAPPSTLMDVIEGTPGVAENGQGGHFQTYSIRGVAGQRVLNLLAGARLVTDRRAGVSFSFVDPLLLGTIDILRGPSSSYYGSGALGGVVQAFPRRFERLELAGGYSGAGDETWQLAGWGEGPWSLGVAHREAGDATTPDGERLFSRFEQWSGVVERIWTVGEDTSLEVVVMPSAGRDIGKPNRDFPERATLYPQENHLVASVTARKPGAYRLNLWAHPNELETRVTEGGEASTVDNEAFDFGGNAQWELALPQGFSGRLGVELFGRRGVVGREAGEPATLDGSEDEVAVYGALRRAVGPVTVESGGRFTWLRQENVGFAAQDDSAWSGFVGATAPLDGGFELAGNLGTGLRFPSLSERFFTGTTGRGEVVSNVDLDPERSLSADLGLRWYGERLYASAYVFRTEIDDYIERIRRADGARTFVNLTSGTIDGVEADAFFQVSAALRLSLQGQTIQGESDAGAPLADIPADRVSLGANWRHGHWGIEGRLQHRFAKDDFASGEVAVGAAELLSAAVSYEIRDGFRLSLSGENLLDETYLPSADDQSVPATGRAIGIGVAWRD